MEALCSWKNLCSWKIKSGTKSVVKKTKQNKTKKQQQQKKEQAKEERKSTILLRKEKNFYVKATDTVRAPCWCPDFEQRSRC